MSETDGWIRHGQGKVIALLHGIGARDVLGYWQPFLKVLQNDSELESFGLFVWKYPTHLEPSWWRNLFDSVKRKTLRESAPRIKLLGQVWNSTYQTQFGRYQDVFLICHSMGGLVVKSWISDTLGQGESTHLNTLRHIAFYATPHEGAPVTDVASWNNQLKEMQRESPFIEELGRVWYDRVVHWKAQALDSSTARYNRYIPHLVVAGMSDAVVPQRWAEIRGMRLTLVEGDHSQVIRPGNASDIRYQVWLDDVKKVLKEAPSSQTTQPQVNEPSQPSTTSGSQEESDMEAPESSRDGSGPGQAGHTQESHGLQNGDNVDTIQAATQANTVQQGITPVQTNTLVTPLSPSQSSRKKIFL